MPQWSNPDTGDDDQDKPEPKPEPESEQPLLATFIWWLVVLPLAVAIGFLLARRYEIFP